MLKLDLPRDPTRETTARAVPILFYVWEVRANGVPPGAFGITSEPSDAELVRAAQYRGITTYQDIAAIMGLPQTGSHTGRQTGLGGHH